MSSFLAKARASSPFRKTRKEAPSDASSDAPPEPPSDRKVSLSTLVITDDQLATPPASPSNDPEVSSPPRKKPASSKPTFGLTYASQLSPATEPPASLFNLRIGPNYSRTGKKAPSTPALYKLIGVDAIQATQSVLDPAELYELYHPPDTPDICVPHSFVVNCNLPTEAPALFGGNPVETAACNNLVFHFAINDWVVAELQSDTTSPAVALLKQWCKLAPTDRSFMGRMKAICVIDAIEKLGLPSFINKFNGKPVLINKSGSVTRYGKDGVVMAATDSGECDVLIMNIQVGVFAFVARKGLYSLLDKFVEMVMNVAFTIQGNEDGELPEVVLGCVRLEEMDAKLSPTREIN